MKKILCFCGILFLAFIDVFSVRAKMRQIPLDDSYVEGTIVALESESQSAEENEIERYSFQVDKPSTIELHFITHINNMRFQIKDIDENIIIDEYIRSEYSPYDYSMTLEAGVYTLHIIKIAPTGMLGVVLSDDNVGDYKFKMKSDYILKDETSGNMDRSDYVELGKTYIGYFASRNNSDYIDNEHKLRIGEQGEYTLSLKSDVRLSYSVRDKDENEVQSEYVYSDEIHTEELVLDSGEYTIIVSSDEVGKYEIDINPNELEINEGENEVENEIKEKHKESEINKTNDGKTLKTSFLKKFFSPGTFSGAILVAVIAGVLVAIILKKTKLN